MPSTHQPLQRAGRLAVLFACALMLVVLAVPAGAAAAGTTVTAAKAKAAKNVKKKRKRSRRDRDGDGIPNGRDGDVDGDGIPNGRDGDVDGDRIPNESDRNIDSDRRRNSSDRDIDGDRRLNTADYDIDADGRNNDYDHDIDSDGVENAYDDDSDSSGDATLGAAGVVHGQPGFVGLVSDDAFWGTDSDPSRARTMSTIASTGATTLRAAFLWSTIEQRPGHFDFELHDGFMEAAARKGISVLPILFDPPSFRSSRPASGAARGVYPPADNSAFARYASELVRRYGPGGKFWKKNPHLHQLPIRSWQVWNEPNIPFYWGGRPDPAAYAQLVKAAAAGIKAVDPGAKVVTAGLNDSELGIKLSDFVDGMYAAGAKDSFDVLALHPYAPASDLVIDQVARAVDKLEAAGDDARVLITELGWATAGPAERALVVDEAAQAALIRSTIGRLSRLHTELRLDGLFYFNWRDTSATPGTRDHWGLHTGLFRQDGSAKPAFGALAEAARATAG